MSAMGGFVPVRLRAAMRGNVHSAHGLVWPGADCLPLVKGYAKRTFAIHTCEAGANTLQASGWRIPLRSAAVRRRWAFFLRWFVPTP